MLLPAALRSLLLLSLMLLANCTTLPPQAAAPISAHAVGQNGVRLHYLDFGGRGDPVLLLPGAGNTAWIYSRFGADLARDHRVFALSRRGHGESEMPETGYDQATLAEDIRLFLDQQRIEKVHLIGHSLAGSELTTFATKYPGRVASLVYLDAAYDRAAQAVVERGAPDRPVPASAADRASPDAFIAYLFRSRPIFALYPRDVVERDSRSSIAVRADGTVGFRMGEKQFNEMLKSASAAPPDYSAVRAPALAIYAMSQGDFRLKTAPPDKQDDLRRFLLQTVDPWRQASIAQFRRGMSRGEIVEMDAVHHLFLHKAEQTAALVRAFLNKHRITN